MDAVEALQLFKPGKEWNAFSTPSFGSLAFLTFRQVIQSWLSSQNATFTKG